MTTERRVWFVTGATRGLGREMVWAARAAGHSVVATGRRVEEVHAAFGGSDDVYAVPLDVTRAAAAETAAAAAVERFGRIDVLVNNAGASYKGYFEEMSPEQVAAQLEVNLIGPMNVCRAVLPHMRRQRSGTLVTMSSGAALAGFEYSSVYAASKAGLEGWMSALEQEVAPFGIHALIVNPGFFRTGLAGPESLVWPDRVVDDYAERSATRRAWWTAVDGTQPGDPAKLARAIVEIVDGPTPMRRLLAGRDVLELAERKADELRQQIAESAGIAGGLGVDG